jgi:3-keto-disaccharide hydrolase
MKAFRSLALFVLSGLVLGCAPNRPNPDANREEWIELFNGRDLTAWTPKIRGEEAGSDVRHTFRVEDGLLTVDYDEYGGAFEDQFGHLFYNTPFSHYLLAVEYRFIGDQLPDGPGWAFRNSGLMLHGQDPARMGLDQDFPISIEVQLLGGNGTDERPTANLCTPGTNVVMEAELVTRHCTNAESPTFHGDDWVRVEVVVMGDSLIAHAVEGEPVLAYSKPQLGGGSVGGYRPEEMREGAPLREGTISIQSESHPVQFRKIELLDMKGCMDAAASNFRSYFVASAPERCVFEP